MNSTSKPWSMPTCMWAGLVKSAGGQGVTVLVLEARDAGLFNQLWALQNIEPLQKIEQKQNKQSSAGDAPEYDLFFNDFFFRAFGPWVFGRYMTAMLPPANFQSK